MPGMEWSQWRRRRTRSTGALLLALLLGRLLRLELGRARGTVEHLMVAPLLLLEKVQRGALPRLTGDRAVHLVLLVNLCRTVIVEDVRAGQYLQTVGLLAQLLIAHTTDHAQRYVSLVG